jgi:hypothetical protein
MPGISKYRILEIPLSLLSKKHARIEKQDEKTPY